MKQRKRYFIEKNFQTRFVVTFCAVVFVSSLVLGGFLFLLSKGSTTVAIENTRVVVKNTADFLLPLILTTVIVVSVFSAVSVGILCIFVSHKIVGPLYRLRRQIQKIGQGDFNVDFHIRADDQMQDLAMSLGEMTSSLRDNIKSMKESFEVLYPQMKESSLDEKEVAKLRESLDTFTV